MKKVILFAFVVMGLVIQAGAEDLKATVADLEERLMAVERSAALDRLAVTGDFRFEAHRIDKSFPSHIDGMAIQNGIVNTLFYYQGNGAFPPSVTAVSDFIDGNYADYLNFLANITYDDIGQAMSMFPPAAQQQLMGMLAPSAMREGYDDVNDILYTSRLRLQLGADLAENVSFAGRLSAYKAWGDSTGVQVLNGQANTLNIDGTTVGVPNSDILRVERAYFTWKDIAGLPVYLSIGRRPSTGGVPMHLRNDEPRGGTPMGSLINYQFDGMTLGYKITDWSTFRLCYGLGYESGFGNGQDLPSISGLKDTSFFGINWDLVDKDNMFLQTTIARAFDVADGFNGLVVLPNDPVTGAEIPAPMVLRFTPSANLGNIDLASIVLMREDGPFDWFCSLNYMSSDPESVTTPFGGLFSDPFTVPESQDGWMAYVGLRYTLPNEVTRVGIEYNHGSEYWFNFAAAEDDIVGAKTATRGDVVETYVTHRINKNLTVKADYTHYSYDYSGSGWHVGAPKDLDETPMLGFATPDSAQVITASMTAKF